jgi:hypothetical protein
MADVAGQKRSYRTRGRDIIFSPVDEAVFAAALHRDFPGVLFTDRMDWEGDRPPFRDSPLDCDDRRQLHILVPERPGPPEVAPPPSLPGWYCLRDSPERELTFLPSHWAWRPQHLQPKWAWDPPTLDQGWIWCGFGPEEKRQIAFIRHVWRLIERIATNAFKAGHPLGNALMGCERTLTAECKGGMVWIGHHALEWSRAGGPRRMLDGKFRPCDDWAPPADEWYRSASAPRWTPATAPPSPSRRRRRRGWWANGARGSARPAPEPRAGGPRRQFVLLVSAISPGAADGCASGGDHLLKHKLFQCVTPKKSAMLAIVSRETMAWPAPMAMGAAVRRRARRRAPPRRCAAAWRIRPPRSAGCRRRSWRSRTGWRAPAGPAARSGWPPRCGA